MSDFRCTEEFVKELFDAGMDVIRVNSAHVTEEGATRIVEIVHKVNPAIPIMIDTKGPEIRVTTIADEYGNSIHFRAGDRVAVRGSDGSDMTTRKVVYMNVLTIVRDIPVGGADAHRRRRVGDTCRGQERHGARLRVRRGRRHAFAQERQCAGRLGRSAVGDREGPPLHRVGRAPRRRFHRPFVRALGARHPGRAGDPGRPRQPDQDHFEDREPGGAGQYRRDHRSVVRHHGGARRPGRGAAGRGDSPTRSGASSRSASAPNVR